MSDLDVVIVAYRSRDTISESVHDAFALPQIASVTVVDNGDDGSGDLAASAGAGVVRLPGNPGFGAAQNRGVQQGAAPVVLLLNPDARPEPSGIGAGRRYLDEHPNVAAVQGTIVNRASGEAERSHGVELGPLHLVGRAFGARRLRRFRVARALGARTAFRDHVDREVGAATEVESLAATMLLVRRAAFEDVGGFDPGYFLYGEDLDLCRRLRAQGWRLVALPETFGVHESGGSAHNAWERELTWWQGTMRFAAQWWTTPQWLLAVTAALVRWVGLVARRPRECGRVWRAVVASGLQRPAGRRGVGSVSRRR